MSQGSNLTRAKSALAVAAVHLLLGYALITGLRSDSANASADTLKLFDLVREPPPSPLKEEPAPEPARTNNPEGAASPSSLRARPKPVQTPPISPVEVTPPIAAPPVPGPDSSSGAAYMAGSGIGVGGEGTGAGSGDSGDGTGGGRLVTRARHVSGRIVDADYPVAAGDAGAQGTVVAHFNVSPNGRVSGCRIVDTSGDAELDATTCRLIERRFRYEPARDAKGRAVADITGWKEVWWIGSRRHPPVSGPARVGRGPWENPNMR